MVHKTVSKQGRGQKKKKDRGNFHEKIMTEGRSMVEFSFWVFRVFMMTITNKNKPKQK